MHVDQDQITVDQPIRLDVRAANVEDIKLAFRAGLRDLTKRPLLSLFFGLTYAFFGVLLIAGLTIFDQIWLVVAAGVGFPLAAPFLAAGLYEMSRRIQRGEPFAASDIFLVIFRQRKREFGWMSFVVLFVLWIWAYQIRLIFALTLPSHGFGSLEIFIGNLFTTVDGALFLGIGTLVGGVLAAVLYTITVIAMPLLLDKNVDFVTAMITSMKTVHSSPVVMLSWGAVVGALTLLAIAPLFLGIIFIFPLLGHTTWHLYERLVSEA